MASRPAVVLGSVLSPPCSRQRPFRAWSLPRSHTAGARHGRPLRPPGWSSWRPRSPAEGRGCSAYSEPPEQENPSACWTNLWNAASTAALSLRATAASQIRVLAVQRSSKRSPPAGAPVSAASARRPRSVHRARRYTGLAASGLGGWVTVMGTPPSSRPPPPLYATSRLFLRLS
jgi:hypothetical protein